MARNLTLYLKELAEIYEWTAGKQETPFAVFPDRPEGQQCLFSARLLTGTHGEVTPDDLAPIELQSPGALYAEAVDYFMRDTPAQRELLPDLSRVIVGHLQEKGGKKKYTPSEDTVQALRHQLPKLRTKVECYISELDPMPASKIYGHVNQRPGWYTPPPPPVVEVIPPAPEHDPTGRIHRNCLKWHREVQKSGSPKDQRRLDDWLIQAKMRGIVIEGITDV